MTLKFFKSWQQFGFLALVGLLLSWLISCGTPASNNSSTSGAKQVEFWTMQLQPKFTDYFNQLIAQFEKENPDVKIRWVDVPWEAMQRKILTAVSAKTAPDVVNLNPDFASQLAARNAWLDLDRKITSEQKAEYLPKIWQAGTLGGKSFGIPWYLTSRVAIYNQALLKQAGVTTPPKTFTELAQVAKQVKDQTGKYAFFTTVVPEDSAEVMESFVQMGVQLVDQQGKAAFNTPAGKAAFQYWTDLYKQGLVPPEVLTEGHRYAVELYQSGRTGILASGPEFLNAIATNAPDVAKVSSSAPQITGETGKKNVAVMNLLIPRDTDQPEMAVKFALFVTNSQNQLAFAKAANVLPSNVKALADQFFTAAPANATPVEQARVVSAAQMKDAQVLVPPLKNVKQLQKVIYDNLQAAMLGQKTVDQAIADAAKEWDQRSS
ncbi:MAG: sugar ABC transporter substrate-binding protein [Aphanocapsa sp. GSE-SYN-MK-11-07L]|jgi:putative chitobiose transport system substrate-binding protein|nr:sugar ABC transporter substrate-binding protein [Aphanocapsa sp. GSE-SYN-MK-11-07L]